jgi:hypothetical protein
MPDFLERRPRYRELHHSIFFGRHDEEMGTANRSSTKTLPRTYKELRRQPNRWNKSDRVRIHAEPTNPREPLRSPGRRRRRRRIGNPRWQRHPELEQFKPDISARTERILTEPERIDFVTTLEKHHKRVYWTPSKCCGAVSSPPSTYATRCLRKPTSTFLEDKRASTTCSLPGRSLCWRFLLFTNARITHDCNVTHQFKLELVSFPKTTGSSERLLRGRPWRDPFHRPCHRSATTKSARYQRLYVQRLPCCPGPKAWP